jgi:uncharacterized protein GlcG (DUF336 family)
MALSHEQALTITTSIVERAAGPVSVVVTDDHGEILASLRMDGAPLDTYLNAHRKAYTAVRSGASTSRAVAANAASAATELASFDPFYSFFLGGVAALAAGVPVGGVGVSGLVGEVDEELAIAGIRSAGLDAP